MWRMMKNMTECARSAVMLDGEISNYVDIVEVLLIVGQGWTPSPSLFEVYIDDMILVAVEAAKQGVTVRGEGKVSVLILCG